MAQAFQPAALGVTQAFRPAMAGTNMPRFDQPGEPRWEYALLEVQWLGETAPEKAADASRWRQERSFGDSVEGEEWIAWHQDSDRWLPLPDALAGLGSDGWEMVAAHPQGWTHGGQVPGWENPPFLYVFKRPKQW